MRKRPLFLLTLGLVAACGVVTVVSCTGDDGFLYPDSGVDATAPKDVSQPDSRVPPPPPPVDGGADAKADAADASDASDASDAADTSVITTDASTIVNHRAEELKALCDLTARCCLPGAIDGAKCRTLYGGYGFQGDLVNVSDDVLNAGRIQVNTGTASDCYAKLRALPCTSLTAATYAAVVTSCYGAIQGTVAVGGDCRATIECQPGNFCSPFTDGGTFPTDAGLAPIIGKCAPIKAVAATCGEDQECAYRSNGNACDPATSKCVGPLANDSECRFSGQCTSKLCVGTCATTIPTLFSSEACSAFQ